MIKNRKRPQPRLRQISLEREDATFHEREGDRLPPLSDLIELRKLRRKREGIDAAKLNTGVVRKKKRPVVDEGGLKRGSKDEKDLQEDEAGEEEREARARRVVRANNFTQQTNILDVDKHMLAYIEENLKIRSRPREDSDDEEPQDPQEALYQIANRWKTDKPKPPVDEGSVTNSLTMLTAIPEVDLGMDTRLRNIEDTEKAKRVVAEERSGRKRANNDEAHLTAPRFYRPNLRAKSDADILRDAKLEAMGMRPEDGSARQNHQEKTHMATDEIVMERFKKRMRK